jgi:hypothetical protein
MRPAYSRCPKAPMTRRCSGSIRSGEASFRWTGSMSPVRSAPHPQGRVRGAGELRFPRHARGLRGSGADLDQRRDLPLLHVAPRHGPGAFGRGLGRRRACRRRLRRRAGRGVLRRVDVLAAQGRLQDRARVADRAAQLRRLPPVRHAIRDGAPGIAGRRGTAAPRLSRHPSPRRSRSQRISTRCRGTCRLRTCWRISAPRRRNADAPAR